MAGHQQIEHADGGGFIVHDRGSASGTQVDGRTIGGRDTTGSLPLGEGSEIVIGAPESPYRFAVRNLHALVGGI